jgi:hypothetical protein
MEAPPRSRNQRIHDTIEQLENGVDAWVATADPDTGSPYLIPLSYLWDGRTLLFSTPATSPTARNLLSGGRVRIGLGATRDVVLIEGAADAITSAHVDRNTGDAFAARTGFDPRELSTTYLYFRVRPIRVQA